MIITKNEHSKQKFTCGNSAIYVNLYNGNLIAEYLLSTLGVNSFELTSSISYNTNYKNNDFNGKVVGFGNGWKLNIHQYVFKYSNSYNIEGFTENDYLYIDGNWNIHKFVFFYDYDETSKVYYKADNATVKLYVDGNGYRIEDDKKNKLIFNEAGVLIQVISCLNENIVKQIVYENGKIISYYDSREPTTKMLFSYDVNNVLKKIYNNDNNNDNNNKNTICYNLNFEDNKLMSIDKSEGARHKGKIENVYNLNNKIKYIVNNSDNTAIQIDYLLENNTYKASKVSEGSVKKNIMIKPCCENYISKNTYVDPKTYLNTKFSEFESKYYTMTEEYINNSISYVYCSNYTDTTNKYGTTIRNYLNTSGQVISRLDARNNDYYDLQKRYGVKVFLNGTSNKKINNEICYATDDTILSLDDLNIDNPFVKFKVESGESTFSLFDKYSLGFWVMFDKQLQNAYIELQHTNDECTRVERFFLENTLPNTWQYVSLEGTVFVEEFELKEIMIKYCGIDSGTEITMSNIVINGSTTPVAKMFKNSDVTDESSYGVPLMMKMFYIPHDSINDSKIVQNITSDYYMTNSDINLTYKSMCLSRLQNKENYELYYCGCKKVLLVKEAGMVLSEEIAIGENNSHIFFTLINGKPNYYLQVKNHINEGLWNVTRNYLNVENDYYGYYLNIKTVSKKVLISEQNADDNESYIINSIYLNGLKRGSQYDNGLIIQYEYDNYGNVLNVMSWNPEEDYTDGSPELISVHYEYDDSEEIYRKAPNLIYNNGNSTTYDFDKILGKINKTIDEKKEIIYEYDRFKDNIEKITFKKSNNSGISYVNSIGYYDNGYIKELSDEDNNYGFKLNGLSQVDSVYNNKVSLFKNKKEEDQSNIKLITTIYDSTEGFNNFIKLYDKEGNLQAIKENDIEKIKFNYLTLEDCSNYFKILDSVNDNYENSTYQYSYDNELNSYVEENHDGFNIKSYGNNCQVYHKENENYKIQVISTSNIINGLVEETSYVKFNNEQQNVNDEFKDFNYTYEYDGFLRLKKKTSKSNSEKSIKYVHNKQLPSTVEYKLDSSSDLVDVSYTNFYTDNMLTKVIHQNDEYLYNYDSFDRLTSENNPLFGELDYEYDDNTRMLIAIKKEEDIQTLFHYELGKLTSIEKNGKMKNILYDKQGNIISLGDIQLSYNLRGLLETYSYNTNGETIKYVYYYDHQNRRCKIEKKVINNNVETLCFTKKFFYNGNQLVREEFYNVENDITKVFHYFYDTEGICGIRYNNKNYSFLKDSLMNVSYVIRNKAIIGKYEYDAWGNLSVIAYEGISNDDAYVLNNNPFRYKGYYYDVETQLYWVSSRYYSPELCRWISPDLIEYLDPSSINGLNLYCYCYNNPIMYVDPNGHSALLIIGLLAGSFALGFGTSVVGQGLSHGWDEINYLQAGIDGLIALGTTVLSFTGIPAWGMALIGVGTGFGQYAMDCGFHNKQMTWLGAGTATVLAGIFGFIGGPGVRNSKAIIDDMVGLSDDGIRAINAITKAANNRVANRISQRGFQATINRYGKIAFNAVQDAIPGTIRHLMLKGIAPGIYLPITNSGVSYLLGYAYNELGWC